MAHSFPPKIIKKLHKAMQSEITEYHVYTNLKSWTKDKHNQEILGQIAKDELRHYSILKTYAKKDISPSRIKILYFTLIAKILGLTFAIKLMEKGEGDAQINYNDLSEFFPEAKEIALDENEHEKKLIELINEERLKYIGSVVLGLNDALVELTGALAGFTLALQDAKLIAMVGLITGLSASISMAVSEYLSTKHEETDKDPIKASIYTGIAYVFVVSILILPFFFSTNIFLSLAITIFLAIIIIFKFTYYVHIAQDKPLWSRFFEMAIVSLSVAAISFGIGHFARYLFNVG